MRTHLISTVARASKARVGRVEACRPFVEIRPTTVMKSLIEIRSTVFVSSFFERLLSRESRDSNGHNEQEGKDKFHDEFWVES